MGGTSGPQKPDPARLGHARPGACTEQLRVEGTKEIRVPSLGQPRREERPRGIGDRCAQGLWAS